MEMSLEPRTPVDLQLIVEKVNIKMAFESNLTVRSNQLKHTAKFNKQYSSVR